MNDTNRSLPPIPDTDSDIAHSSEQTPVVPPPVPKKADSAHKDESPLRRLLRYVVAIGLIVAATVAALILYNFVHDVLMDEQNSVETQDITLDEYVINDPPEDTRRSHVRMKPGAHPEAGYRADESVLIRERAEDEKFREQSGLDKRDEQARPRKEEPKREQPKADEGKPAEPSADHAAAPSEHAAPAQLAQPRTDTPVSIE